MTDSQNNLSDLALDRINGRQDAEKAEFYSLQAILDAHGWKLSTWRNYYCTMTSYNRKSPPCFPRGQDHNGNKLYLFPIKMYWEWVDWCSQNPTRRLRRDGKKAPQQRRKGAQEPSKYSARAVLAASKAS